MIGSRYFEIDPWDRTLELISERDLGRIVEVQVQSVCGMGETDSVVDRWKRRIEATVGSIESWDELRRASILSVLGKAGGAIVRIFIDENADCGSENFELVLTNGLVIWNTSLHPVSMIYEDRNKATIMCRDAMPNTLAQVV